MKAFKARIGIGFLIALLGGPVLAQQRSIAPARPGIITTTHPGVITSDRPIPQGNGSFFLYDPGHDLYEWKIKDGDESEPCYYNEAYGQWIGSCNISLDQPGYSITVPNRVR